MDTTVGEMNEQQMEGRIHTLKVMRDAQVEGGEYWATYQQQITELTGELLNFQEQAPIRAWADGELKAAQVALTKARGDADASQDPCRPMAVAGGALGTACLLMWLWLGGATLAGFAVACFAGGVWGLMASIRWRRRGLDKVIAAQVSVDRLMAERPQGGAE